MITLYGLSSSPHNTHTFTAKSLGLLGELTAAKKLQASGFNARRATEIRKGDLEVSTREITRNIEVKTSLRGKDGAFQFCLYRKVGERGCTDHSYADFVLLLCVEDDYSVVGLLIPADKLTQKKIQFRDPLLCKWRRFLVWQ